MRFASLVVVTLCALLLSVSSAAQPAEATIPTNNRPGIEAPPRPPVGALEGRMRALMAAIEAGDAEAAISASFLSREAFRQIKGVADPDRFYDRLLRETREGVTRYHGELPRGARLERVELRNCRWVEPRVEANRLPYWSCLHNRLHYRVGTRTGVLKVRALITWGDEWYVTHLAD